MTADVIEIDSYDEDKATMLDEVIEGIFYG